MLHLIVGDRDLTDLADGLSGSNIDGGGYETLSFTLPDGAPLPPMGTKVRAFFGLEPLWEGRVEEPGQQYRGRRSAGQVSAVGAGVAGKDDQMSMIYADHDHQQWKPAGLQRQLDIIQIAGRQYHPPHVTADPTSGNPRVITGPKGAWQDPPQSEAWYDAGPTNLIGGVHYSFGAGTHINHTHASWFWGVYLGTTDTLSSFNSTGNLRASAGAGYIAAAGAARFAMLHHVFASAPDGVDGRDFHVVWSPVVFGNHGLPRRGPDPGGFYPQDIARHAFGFFRGVDIGQIDEDTGFIVMHAVYREKVDPEKPVTDMALLAGGWHWGVWSAPGMDGPPQSRFTRPPAEPTCWVARADCENSDLTERLSDVHDTIHVSFTDASGTRGEVTVTRPNPRLPAALAGKSRLFDMGRGSAAAATLLGQQILTLEEQQSRAAGWLELPDTVQTPTGRKPSCLLRAGIDRIRVTDLPNAGPWTETDTRRFDTFRIKRVAWSGSGRRLKTRVELDAGADLVEVAQARMAIDATLAG